MPRTVPEEPARPRLELAALAICLAGLAGLATAIWALKHGAPLPRPAVLALLAMTCAPFYVGLVRGPKPLHLLPGLVAVFLLYPIANPHGFVYSRDPLFNYQFSHILIESDTWIPGSLTGYARTYSYYPLGNTFLGAVMSASNLPGPIAYLWVEPLVRLLALPAAVYALGRRLFGEKEAAVGLLLYLGTGSILFNLPVQQGIGVIFVALSLLALAMITTSKSGEDLRFNARALFVLSSAAVVMTHHLSSYFLAIWLGLVAVIALTPHFREKLRPVRLGGSFLFYLAVLVVYAALLTGPLILRQTGTVEDAISNFIDPGDASAKPVTLGRTFQLYEIAWLAGSIFLLLVLALLARKRLPDTAAGRFVSVTGLVAALLMLATLPMIATSLNFVPLRFSEFANIVLAPLAAVTLVAWAKGGAFATKRFIPAALRQKRSLSTIAAVAAVAVIFMGGQFAPLSLRSYFEAPSARTTDSPLYVGEDALRAGAWAHDHVNGSRVWSDQLGLAAFGSFGEMRVEYGHYRIFRSATMDASTWAALEVGDYVAVNSRMTTDRPDFLDNENPTGPITAAAVGKFGGDRHFAAVYSDATFTLYRVMSLP